MEKHVFHTKHSIINNLTDKQAVSTNNNLIVHLYYYSNVHSTLCNVRAK